VKASERDIRDGLQHWVQGCEEPVRGTVGFKVSKRMMPLKEILAEDDYSSWGDFNRGELASDKPEDAYEALKGFRGADWADRATTWIREGRVPPILVIRDTKRRRGCSSGIVDGRGRVNLAMAMDMPSLPVVLLQESDEGTILATFDEHDNVIAVQERPPRTKRTKMSRNR
jgi:hypothetical protein